MIKWDEGIKSSPDVRSENGGARIRFPDVIETIHMADNNQIEHTVNAGF